MAELLLSPGLQLALLAGTILCTTLALKKNRLLWSVWSGICAIALCLLGLAAGQTLEALLTAVLVPTAMVLHALSGRKGGGEG